MQALNRHVERVFNLDRKNIDWESASGSGTNENTLRISRTRDETGEFRTGYPIFLTDSFA
jgi:hypothetical protein